MQAFVGLAVMLAGVFPASAAEFDGAKIDEITGLKGKFSEKEGVYKIALPRNDVPVSIDAWKAPPFMGLSSWAAFKKSEHNTAMMMGDTVLFEDEVNPVMSVALDNGLAVTALHNHFFFDQPRVYFMHIAGEGDPEQLAGAVRKVYDKVKEIRSANPQPRSTFGDGVLPDKNAISPEPLNLVFGLAGEMSNGMVKFTFGRRATMHGMEIDNTMGINTWAAFAGSDADAVVDGDFAVTEDELQAALKALRRAQINIVAIHSHMTHEEPRILFFHYWGRGQAKELAQAIKDALPASYSAKK